MTFYTLNNTPSVTVNGEHFVVDLYDPETAAVQCVYPSPDPSSETAWPLPEGFQPMITYWVGEHVPDTDPAEWELGEPVSM